MHPLQSEVVEFSVRIYRMFLWLYPTEHRDDYGWLMVQLFRDRAYDAMRRGGAAGILIYWLASLLDLIRSVVEERREERITMSSSNIVNMHPYLFMAAGALFASAGYSQLQPDDKYSFYGLYAVSMVGLPVAIVMLAAGLYGLKNSAAFGRLGRLGLNLGIGGAGLAPFFLFLLPLSEVIWGMMMLCFAALFVSLILLGVDVLRQRNFAGWISLPLLISGIIPFVVFPLDPVDIGPRYVSFVGIVIVGLCWIIFGNYLRQTMHTQLVTE